MGIVSFTILMVEADSEADAQTEWIQGIDFAHVVLFYVAMFFVAHAFIIMRISFSVNKEYIVNNCLSLQSLVSDIDQLNERKSQNYWKILILLIFARVDSYLPWILNLYSF